MAVTVGQQPRRHLRLRVSQIQHWKKHGVSFELPVMMMVLVLLMPLSSWYGIAGTVVGAVVVAVVAVVVVCLFVVPFRFVVIVFVTL